MESNPFLVLPHTNDYYPLTNPLYRLNIHEPTEQDSHKINP